MGITGNSATFQNSGGAEADEKVLGNADLGGGDGGVMGGLVDVLAGDYLGYMGENRMRKCRWRNLSTGEKDIQKRRGL